MPENGVNTEGSRFVDGVDNVDNLGKKAWAARQKQEICRKRSTVGKSVFHRAGKKYPQAGLHFLPRKLWILWKVIFSEGFLRF